jgi:hypothetical protein
MRATWAGTSWLWALAGLATAGCGREDKPAATPPSGSPPVAASADAGSSTVAQVRAADAGPALPALYAPMFKPGPFGVWSVKLSITTPAADGGEAATHTRDGSLNCNVTSANQSDGAPLWTATIACQGDDVKAWLAGAIGKREVVTPAAIWTADPKEVWVDVGMDPAADDSDEHGTKLILPAEPQTTRRQMATDDQGATLVEDFIERPSVPGVAADAWCQRRVHANKLALTHCFAPHRGLVAIAAKLETGDKRVELVVLRGAD